MKKYNFDKIANSYENKAVVQKTAAEKLLNYLEVRKNSGVLDLGCGVGNITEKIAKLTQGQIVAMDKSVNMLKQAKKRLKNYKNIKFQLKGGEELSSSNKFDIIFCNSVLQWFEYPEVVLAKCYKALKVGGQIAIQAPATKNYCPNFIKVISKVEKDPLAGKIFAKFKSPWFFLDTAKEYSQLLKSVGFEISLAKIVREKSKYSLVESFEIFSSGAAAGYFNQAYYSVELFEDYLKKFKQIVKQSLSEQSNTHKEVELVFNRIYLVANK